jgi:hypothetical protein
VNRFRAPGSGRNRDPWKIRTEASSSDDWYGAKVTAARSPILRRKIFQATIEDPMPTPALNPPACPETYGVE